MKTNMILKIGGVTCVCLLFSLLGSAQKSPDSYYCIELSSRCPQFLRPSSVHSASFEDKGDLVIGVMNNAIGVMHNSIPQFAGSDILFAYSPLKGLGLTLSRNHYNQKFSRTIFVGNKKIDGSWPLGGSSFPHYKQLEYKLKGNTTYLAVGYYKALGYGFVWDAYVSVGRGKMKIGPEQRTNSFSANLTKRSLQSSLNWRVGFIELGTCYSIASQKFKDLEGDVLDDLNYFINDSSQKRYLSGREEHLISELAMNVSFHVNNIEIFLQYTRAWNHKHPDFRMYNTLMSLGAQCRIGTRKKVLDSNEG